MLYASNMAWLHRSSLAASAITVAALCVLFSVSAAYGQSVPGFQAPEKPKTQDEISLSLKAARGQAPLRYLYDHLKVDATVTKHLPALDAREKLKKLPGKALRIGAVRTLPESIKGSSDGTVYQVAEGDVRVIGVVLRGVTSDARTLNISP